jgi:hypothetical protein
MPSVSDLRLTAVVGPVSARVSRLRLAWSPVAPLDACALRVRIRAETARDRGQPGVEGMTV